MEPQLQTTGPSEDARLQSTYARCSACHQHAALLAWAGGFSSFTLGRPFSKRVPILDVVSVETAVTTYEASLIPVGSVVDLPSVTRSAMVSWATAPVVERGHRLMVTLLKWLRLYVRRTAFSRASSASNRLLSPSFTSTPGAGHITIDDEPGVSVAFACLDSATTPSGVTCTQDASTAVPPQPDSVDVAAAILPQRLLFNPPVGNPHDYETDRIIDQLNQRHEHELSRLGDEHLSHLQVPMRDNTHDAALRDLRAQVNGFDAQPLCAGGSAWGPPPLCALRRGLKDIPTAYLGSMEGPY